MWDEEKKRIEEGIEIIKKDDPENAEALGFLKDLLLEQLEMEKYAYERLRGTRDRYLAGLEKVYDEKRSLISVVGFPAVQEFEWAEMIKRIIGVVRRHRPDLSEQLDRLEKGVDKKSFSIGQLIGSLIKGEDDVARGVAAGLIVDLDVVKAISLWTVQPILRALYRHVRDYLRHEYWGQGYCPICGSYTRTGYMAGEGRKLYMKCQVCGAEWRFQRLKCPFCGNEDQEKLGFYRFKDDERFRLYVCHNCKRYWKVVDETLVGTRVPRILYDAWTRHLDEVAAEKGFH